MLEREYGAYEDKFSGRSLDEEIDTEEGFDEISSEDMARDLKNAAEEVKGKVTETFYDRLQDIIDNVELYYSKGEWDTEVIEPLNDLLDEISMADEDEALEREDEFRITLSEIEKASRDLKKVR